MGDTSHAAGGNLGLSFCRIGSASIWAIYRRGTAVTGIEPLILLFSIGDATLVPVWILARFRRSDIRPILAGLGWQAARGVGPVI